MTAAIYLAAILAILPVPAFERNCITRNHDRIVAQADAAAEAEGIPVETLLVVGFLEAHLGCARHSGGCWGAPIDPHHRGVAGSPRSAARALAWGYRRCGDTLGAITHFRTGHCSFRRSLVGYEPSEAVRLLERVVASAAQMQSEEQDGQ